jgi:Flp pilus assembly pilin Flp
MLRLLFTRYLGDERGAEIVEWIVVAIILAITAGLVFGPNGVLQTALEGGINRISSILGAAGGGAAPAP